MRDLPYHDDPQRRFFLADALAGAFNLRTALPGLLLLAVVAGSNAIVLLNPLVAGLAPSEPFIAAAALRIAGVYLLAAAILRLATRSTRRAWLPDGAFLWFFLLYTFCLVVPAVVTVMLGDASSVQTSLAGRLTAAVLASILAPWVVAAAVERPIAWNPAPWLRRPMSWLPQRLAWGLVLLVPLGVAEARLQALLVAGAGDLFWPMVLGEAALGCLILMIGFGLDIAAYRRVALH